MKPPQSIRPLELQHYPFSYQRSRVSARIVAALIQPMNRSGDPASPHVAEPRRVCLVGLIGGGHSGVPRYAAALTRAIDRVSSDYPGLTVTLLTTAAGAEAIHTRSIPVEVVAGKSRWVNAGPGRLALEQAVVRRHDQDLFHYFDVTGPLFSRRRFTATIHDTAFVYGYAPRSSTYKRWLYPWALRRARAAIAVSQFAKDEAVRHFAADPAKISVVHSGPGLRASGDVAASIAADGPPFLLYVGNLGGNKNLPFLVRCFDQAASPARLALVGRARGDTSELRAAIDGAASRAKIDLVGDVSDEELEGLYRSAKALLLPSVYEGFGFTALEAMARGCPVLASDIPALREVAGSGALLLPLEDENAWTAAMMRIVSDEQARADLRSRGATTVERYSWERTARGVLDVLAREASRL
jgi:glycosyltransferase involved in cell wall biosynthesis